MHYLISYENHVSELVFIADQITHKQLIRSLRVSRGLLGSWSHLSPQIFSDFFLFYFSRYDKKSKISGLSHSNTYLHTTMPSIQCSLPRSVTLICLHRPALRFLIRCRLLAVIMQLLICIVTTIILFLRMLALKKMALSTEHLMKLWVLNMKVSF